MNDPIPPPPPARSADGCWKWGAIGCIAVALIGAIAAGAVVFFVMRSPVFKQTIGNIENLQAVEAQLKNLSEALDRYHTEKKSYPPDLAALVPSYVLNKESLKVGKNREFDVVYLKPPKNAGPDYEVIKVNLPAPIPMAGAPPLQIRLRLDGRLEGLDYHFDSGGKKIDIDFREMSGRP